MKRKQVQKTPRSKMIINTIKRGDFDPKCGDCIGYDRKYEYIPGIGPLPGECHIGPPPKTGWPRVQSYDWCAQFKAK